jgi:hypothetical protein
VNEIGFGATIFGFEIGPKKIKMDLKSE